MRTRIISSITLILFGLDGAHASIADDASALPPDWQRIVLSAQKRPAEYR